MSRWVTAIVAMVILLMPLVALKVRSDAEAEMRFIETGVFRTENNPSSVENARYSISNAERREIEEIVASEGGYCSYEFQALVAFCILNGAEAENMRPSELFERGDFWLTHDVEPTETTKQAVSDVFDLGIFPTDEPVRYYYNPNYCKSAAHESFCYVLTCEGCRFFKERG